LPHWKSQHINKGPPVPIENGRIICRLRHDRKGQPSRLITKSLHAPVSNRKAERTLHRMSVSGQATPFDSNRPLPDNSATGTARNAVTGSSPVSRSVPISPSNRSEKSPLHASDRHSMTSTVSTVASLPGVTFLDF
jgi:hypothetical protein